MVKVALLISCTLENINQLSTSGPDFQWNLKDGWVAKCDETGSVFSEVEFGEDGMWAGYDEKGKFPVSIDEFKGEFVRA
ncbi:unnamed protein product [Nezara viridula]|uniref:Uncharacterized protein n=1 Tax=Nezara viridula TaxID=85310 RepID=A0A9P0E534_NEZVI|nr:unnamed protein product [Nezara viridula]